jgi:hypothetical protein
LDCVIGRRGITIQLAPSGLAKLIILKPIGLQRAPQVFEEMQKYGIIRKPCPKVKKNGFPVAILDEATASIVSVTMGYKQALDG